MILVVSIVVEDEESMGENEKVAEKCRSQSIHNAIIGHHSPRLYVGQPITDDCRLGHPRHKINNIRVSFLLMLDVFDAYRCCGAKSLSTTITITLSEEEE